MLEKSNSNGVKTTGNFEIGITGTGRKSAIELFEEIHQKNNRSSIFDQYDDEDNQHDDDDADCFCD